MDVLTIGRYLRPSAKHAEIVRYVEPAEFDAYLRKDIEKWAGVVKAAKLAK